MRGRYPGVALGVLGVLAAGLAGCGSRSGLSLGRVSGQVTYGGQPVRNGTVVFAPDESKGTVGPTGMGVLDKEGRFVLTTSDSGDGALVGHHKVGITGLEPEPLSGQAEAAPPPPSQDSLGYLKGKARSSQQARQAARRPASSKEETFTDRGGRTFRYAIPKQLSSPETSGIAVEVSRGSNTFHFAVKEDGTVSVEQ